MRRKTKLYLTLYVLVALTAVFVAAVMTDSLPYPYACWLIGAEHLERRSDGTFKTDRPEGADESMPIVDHYMVTTGENSEP